jgi:hypothetical protein
MSIFLWVGLIYFLVKTLDKFPAAETWYENFSPDKIMKLLGFGVFFTLAYILRCYRFGYLLRLTAAVEWKVIIKAFPWLFLLGAISPLRLGEAYRAVWVRKHQGNSSETLGYWIAERFTDLIFLVLFLCLGVIFRLNTDIQYSILFYFILILMVAGYLILWTQTSNLSNLMRYFKIPQPLISVVRSFHYMKNTKVHLKVVGLTALIWTLMGAGFTVGLSGFVDTPYLIIFALTSAALVNLSAVVSIMPGNLGSFQAAVIVTAIWYHVDVENAFIGSVFIQSIALLLTIAYGVSAYILSKFKTNEA